MNEMKLETKTHLGRNTRWTATAASGKPVVILRANHGHANYRLVMPGRATIFFIDKLGIENFLKGN